MNETATRPAQQWVNTDADAGALHVLLERIAARLPPDTIDTLWIFPTRRAAALESTVIVAAARTDDPERRRIFTAHFAVSRDRRGNASVVQRMHEHAIAPVDALPRVLDGVLRRLGDEAAQPPRAIQLDADADRWEALRLELGGQPRPDEEPATDTPQNVPAG